MIDRMIRILCVEDDDLDRLIIKRAVKSSGLNIDLSFAEDIDSGKQQTTGVDYDCIFLDYNLPGGSGLELLKYIRANNNQSPVIIVTSQGDENIAVEAMKNGASDYIPKNLLTAEGLSQSLRFVLKMRESEREKTRIQHELSETQKRLAAVVANSPIILFLLDEQGNFTLFEGKGLFQAGINTRSQIGKPIESIATLIPISRDDFNEAMKGSEKSSVCQAGEKFYEIFYTPMKDENNGVKGVIGVAADITIHKLAEEELKKAKQFAEDTAKIKEQFLANMSHEIRTPMNGIMGLTRILLSTPVTDEQLKYLKSIKTCSDNLLVIINDILDLSKIEAGKMNFEKVAFNVEEIIRHTVELFEPKANEKNITLTYSIDKSIPDAVLGDPTRLSQITNNLVSNAIKFTSAGGVTLHLRLRSEREHNLTIDFEVTDTGIGIPETSVSSIFESFTQASSDTTRKFGGTGLGLTIVKRLIELQGGKIGIKSTVGKGTSFFFHLTFSRASREEIEQANKEGDSTLDVSHLRVLVAEDNAINQMIVKKVFSDWGAYVEIADNGVTCVNKLREGAFDIVLMDIQMPEMDGNTAAQKIRHELPLPARNIPIMAMTAHATSTEKQKCFESGMNDYISKPFDPAELKRKLIALTKDSSGKADDIQHTKTDAGASYRAGANSDTRQTSAQPAERDAAETAELKIDLSYLRQIGGDNPAFVMQMIEMFLQKTPVALEEMNEKLKQQSWEDLRNIAHRIKPSFTYIGLGALHRMLAEIEDNSTNRTNLDALQGLISKVEAQSNAAFKALKAELLKLR
jgi:PAS domain S-box-containing protein